MLYYRHTLHQQFVHTRSGKFDNILVSPSTLQPCAPPTHVQSKRAGLLPFRHPQRSFSRRRGGNDNDERQKRGKFAGYLVMNDDFSAQNTWRERGSVFG